LKRIVFAILGIGFGLGLGWWLVNMPPKKNPRFDPTEDDLKIPHFSTRGAFQGGMATPPAGFGALAEGPIPGLAPDVPCAEDLMIVIHGFNNRREKAMNRFGVARESLRGAGYKGTVIGWSWDADTQKDPFSMTGYHQGREQAVANGPVLAEAILSLKRACPNMKIRLIGYSMGARVALEALLHLKEAPILVDSVHLVGAAMDNEEVEIGERYGSAIAVSAKVVVNCFSPEDSKLGMIYWVKEGDRALGKHDVEHRSARPPNYESRNVAKELPDIDEHGNVVGGGKKGSNHSGYLGTRNKDGKLTDDGAMDVVVRDIAQFR
jgi:pimeloyl-ACP methyl ester carboxylesterase